MYARSKTRDSAASESMWGVTISSAWPYAFSWVRRSSQTMKRTLTAGAAAAAAVYMYTATGIIHSPLHIVNEVLPAGVGETFGLRGSKAARLCPQ